MRTRQASIHRLIDLDERPIRIVKVELRESGLGPYMVMEDSKGRVILSGSRAFLVQYSHVPTPFYIT